MTFRLFSLALAVIFSVGVSSAQDSRTSSILKPATDFDGNAGFEAMLSRGYAPLFNGKDLTGWRNPYPYGEARVVNGEIHLLADDKFFLVTEKKYADFRLSVEIHLLLLSLSTLRIMYHLSLHSYQKVKLFHAMSFLRSLVLLK